MLEQYVADHPAARLVDLAYTLNVRREPMAFRAAFLVRSVDEFRSHLDSYCEGAAPGPNTFIGGAGSGDAIQVVSQASAQGDASRVARNLPLEDIARAWVQGQPVDVHALRQNEGAQLVDLPLYPFVHSRFTPPSRPPADINEHRKLLKGPAPIIDIDDLQTPRLSPLQLRVLADASTYSAALDSGAILDDARAETGLADFGREDFIERLDIWLQTIKEDEDVSGLGRMGFRSACVRFAATRLRIEDRIRRHPEILEIDIERPVIIAGLPRSGTTHLLNLLSADSRLRSLPWWEATAPVPSSGNAAPRGRKDQRWLDARRQWQELDAILPHLKLMHGFSPDHISEDIELQAVNFSSFWLEWLHPAPRWRDYYLAHDQSDTYAYLKRCLQVLTHIQGPNRWVLKCPQHMEQLPVLKSTFPDATYVITHRDPVASLQSALTMMCYQARISRRRIDIDHYRNYWVDRYRRLLQRCVADRDCLPEAQTLDVYFHEWTRDSDATIRAVYERAGLPLTEVALKELRTYQGENEHGAKGKIVYNLERDFGVSPEELRAQFSFYSERFPILAEAGSSHVAHRRGHQRAPDSGSPARRHSHRSHLDRATDHAQDRLPVDEGGG